MSAPRERPLVSVIVPFLDAERTLADCVESLLRQEFVGGGVELLLVDNGSSDGSAAIARSFPEVTLLHEPEPGAYPARNAALARARGRFVAFTDSDCVPDRDWLAQATAGLRDASVGVVLGHCRYPNDASATLRLLAAYENAKTAWVLAQDDPGYRFAYANNMAVRAELFDELGPFLPWQRAGDTELVHRLAARRPDLRVVFRPEMRVAHHEFRSSRARARRLSLYARTNAKIPTFRELGTLQRLRILVRALQR